MLSDELAIIDNVKEVQGALGPVAPFSIPILKLNVVVYYDDELKTLAKTDSDAAFDKLTDDFFSNIDNMWENEKVIQMTLNIKKGMTQMTAEINLAEKTTAALKKKKVNTAELEALIKKSKVEFENLKKLVNAKPFNADAVMDSVDILMETRQTYTDKLEDLTGNTEFKPELTATAPTPSIKINVPTGF